MAQDRGHGAIAQQPVSFASGGTLGTKKLGLPAPEQKEETELMGMKKYDKGLRELVLTLRHKKLLARAHSQLL